MLRSAVPLSLLSLLAACAGSDDKPQDDTAPVVTDDCPGGSAEVAYDGVDNDCNAATPDDDIDGDGYVRAEDCDDANAAVSPADREVEYDGLDNDCNPETPDDDLDGDGWDRGDDCDDDNPAVGPTAKEVPYDLLDNDCDPTTPDEDLDGDGYDHGPDCDDLDAEVHPGAAEVCNGYDDNCDGAADEGDASGATTWYLDADRDGYGNAARPIEACAAPSGYVADATDCDDYDASIYPGATEVSYDGVDNDCNADTPDEGDDDGDGYLHSVDCDDTDPAVNPGAVEVAYDGIDNDCDSATADDDLDGDGYARADDCNDANPAINPGEAELCNGTDDNCDGRTDGADATNPTTWYVDADRDGYGASSPSVVQCSAPSGYVSNASDCDDTESRANPGTAEVPYDGIDNDCNSATPDEDLDGDGYDHTVDCVDTSAAAHPGATEVCDGLDNDCDGVTDGPDASGVSTWYADADSDDYGDATNSVVQCTQPSGFVNDATDCDDTTRTVRPGAIERCDGLDNNCDGVVDEACTSDTGGGLIVGGFGGHRIDKDGQYYYALYNDRGFGIMGARDWNGSSDSSSSPEGVTWNDDQTELYYNDLRGNVFVQSEPFGSTSRLVGTFSAGQVGGGVYAGGYYIVGDYEGGNLYAMNVETGATSVYARLGSACKPYFGNSAMAIDVDGSLYAASSCGIVRYTPDREATSLAAYTNLISAVAMNADNELYSIDNSGNIVHFDKSTGEAVDRVSTGVSSYATWTMAADADGNFVVNYWGEQRIYSARDGSTVNRFDSASYYPGSSTYYWYVTF